MITQGIKSHLKIRFQQNVIMELIFAGFINFVRQKGRMIHILWPKVFHGKVLIA